MDEIQKVLGGIVFFGSFFWILLTPLIGPQLEWVEPGVLDPVSAKIKFWFVGFAIWGGIFAFFAYVVPD